jgi:competence protein ComEA
VAERPASTIAIWLVAGALALFAAVRIVGGREQAPAPVRVDGGAGAAGSAGSRSSGGSAASSAARIYVDVAGAVRRPGLIRVSPDTRVATALERAGGPTRRADLTLVNLAAKVQDGQQIIVPTRGAAGAGAGGSLAGGAAAGGAAAGGAAAGGAAGTLGSAPGGSAIPPGARIHLSTATVEQLDQVDGIGPTLAQRIIEYRDAHGGFRSIDQLAQVDGIGEKRLATLRDALQP